MTRRPIAVAILVAVASATAWAQVMVTQQLMPQQGRDSQAAAQTPQTALIMGTVHHSGSGLPADGVRLTLSGSEIRGSRTALTDDEGRYAFVGLPEGSYTLRAVKTGYVSATYGQKHPGRPGTAIVLAEGQRLEDVDLELPKGGVIAGVVYDEKNRPAVSTSVRVMRWSWQSGERNLSSAGTGSTDDRGMYRIFGLVPGEYLVTAAPRNSSTNVVTSLDLENMERAELLAQQAQDLAALAQSGSPIAGARFSIVDGVVQQESPAATESTEPSLGYSTIYYPGTTDLGFARTVTIGVSEEQLGVDFQLQRVPLSRITGQVITPPGVTTSTVQIRLTGHGTPVPGASSFTARAGRDGTFRFNSVPPGAYTMTASASVTTPRPPPPTSQSEEDRAAYEEVLARANADRNRRLWAMADVVVNGGGYQPAVTLSMQEGMKVSGSMSFQGSRPMPPDLKRVRLTLAAHGRAMSGTGVRSINTNADADGRFTFVGVVPGQYRVRASGVSGWTMSSATVGATDTLDFWLEVKPHEDVSQMVVTFGDQRTELTGTLQSHLGQPTADYMVIVFPTDRRYWVPLGRRMRSVRPSTDGKFSFAGLPPGDYLLATVTDVEPGGWYDPALLEQLAVASVPVRLANGQPTVQDLRVAVQ